MAPFTAFTGGFSHQRKMVRPRCSRPTASESVFIIYLGPDWRGDILDDAGSTLDSPVSALSPFFPLPQGGEGARRRMTGPLMACLEPRNERGDDGPCKAR